MSATREVKDLEALGIYGHAGTWLQHSVPISPGNSGGPLVNMKGEVVGANTMTLTIGQNLNFAISCLDITNAIRSRSKFKPLRPGSIPELKISEQPATIDITGTEQAEEMLIKIRTVTVLAVRAGNDPTGRISAQVTADLENAIDKANLRRDPNKGDAFLIAMVSVDGAPGGTQSFRIRTQLFFRDKRGSRQVYTLFDEEEKVGTIAGRAFLQGTITSKLRTSIRTHFRKLSSAINRARLKASRAKKK
jgi:hypothetical protein